MKSPMRRNAEMQAKPFRNKARRGGAGRERRGGIRNPHRPTERTPSIGQERAADAAMRATPAPCSVLRAPCTSTAQHSLHRHPAMSSQARIRHQRSMSPARGRGDPTARDVLVRSSQGACELRGDKICFATLSSVHVLTPRTVATAGKKAKKRQSGNQATGQHEDVGG